MNSEDYRGSRLAFSRINRATSPQLLLFSPRAVSRFFLFFLSADLVRRIVSSSSASFSSTFQRPSQPLRFATERFDATAIISRSRRERSALRGGPLVKNRLSVYSATESQARIKEEEIRRDAWETCEEEEERKRGKKKREIIPRFCSSSRYGPIHVHCGDNRETGITARSLEQFLSDGITRYVALERGRSGGKAETSASRSDEENEWHDASVTRLINM